LVVALAEPAARALCGRLRASRTTTRTDHHSLAATRNTERDPRIADALGDEHKEGLLPTTRTTMKAACPGPVA
jgi:hypothetical protein